MLASIIGVFLCLSVVLKASGATPLPPLESITVRKYAGEVVPNSYIVKLKNGASFTQVTSSIPESHKSIKSFSTGDTNPVFNGFTGKFCVLFTSNLLTFCLSGVERGRTDGTLEVT